jgi:osmotically-inducible protein OsmY
MTNRHLAKLLLGAVLAFSVVACAPTRTRESAGEVIDDSVITTKVKAELVKEPLTKAYQINVETFRGVVQLSGFVDSAQARNKAVAVAKSVGGVKEVRDSLEIKQAE